MTTLPISWRTHDSTLNHSMQKTLSYVEESPFGMYIFGNRKWLVDLGEIVKDSMPYQHVRRELKIEEDNVLMLCGDNMSAYGISDIQPVIAIPSNDDELMCKECALQLELAIWTA